MKQTLWTKDFTIVTLGSAVSMLGNSLIGFAISLLVLDYTNTPFLYALFVFFHTLPQIVMPIIAGPFIDRFSRRRTIYLLDFLSAFLYGVAGLLLFMGIYNFVFLAILALAAGSIQSFYNVAFSSFYPMLITEGNYSKAYSISTILETASTIMIAVSTFLYNLIGIVPLMLITSGFFLLAAIVETQISDVEKMQEAGNISYGWHQYLSDGKEGVRYLWSEKGLLYITLYFMALSVTMGASTVITLPWFRGTYDNGEYVYISVWAFMVIGRVLGSLLHYYWKIPARRKYAIAMAAYLLYALLEGSYLYAPMSVMRVMCLLVGITSATSYNIRISATQSYVPNEKRGRYHGAFLMLTTVGTLTGELLAGALCTYLPMRPTLSAFFVFAFLSAIVLVGGGRQHIVRVYNRNT